MEKQLEFNVLGSQPWLFRHGSAREVPSGGIAHSPKLKCQEKALEIIKHSVQHFLNDLRRGGGKPLNHKQNRNEFSVLIQNRAGDHQESEGGFCLIMSI